MNFDKCVLVLGSGKSILNLTQEEKKFLNSCDVKIGINKYAAFHKIPGISPTHVYFHDDYSYESIIFLKHIFKTLIKDKLTETTFIVSPNYKGHFSTNLIQFFLKKAQIVIANFTEKILMKLCRLLIKPISKDFFNYLKITISKKMISADIQRLSILPKKSKVEYVEIQDWKSRNNKWANDLKQKLYHYRGSFTSVLNYIAIEYPNRNILLAGVDFNSPEYFFEENLRKLNFDTSDWTTQIVKENKKHFSIINFEGTKMDDEFPFIINELEKTNNKMYSLSSQSYLVEQNFVDYISLKNDS